MLIRKCTNDWEVMSLHAYRTSYTACRDIARTFRDRLRRLWNYWSVILSWERGSVSRPCASKRTRANSHYDHGSRGFGDRDGKIANIDFARMRKYRPLRGAILHDFETLLNETSAFGSMSWHMSRSTAAQTASRCGKVKRRRDVAVISSKIGSNLLGYWLRYIIQPPVPRHPQPLSLLPLTANSSSTVTSMETLVFSPLLAAHRRTRRTPFRRTAALLLISPPFLLSPTPIVPSLP